MQRWHIAQVNVAYALGDPADPVMADFNAQLDEINELADRSPGFVWRYISDSRDTQQRELADPRVLFNMSVWDSIESLHAYAYKSAHAKVFASRKKWFGDWRQHAGSLPELGEGAPFLALWWIPSGEIPTPLQGIGRLRLLGEKGPHPQAFTFKRMFTPHGEPTDRERFS